MTYSTLDNVRIGVLRGGTSDEYHESLATGAAILSDLQDFHTHDIFIDREGDWYSKGLRQDPHKLLTHVDVVVNALHGGIGEDGTIQRLLDHHRIPYTGSSATSAAMSLHKSASKRLFVAEGLPTPRHHILQSHDPHKEAYKLIRSFTLPIIVKSPRSGASKGVRQARSFAELMEYLDTAEEIIVEEGITGRIVTCGVIQDYRSHSHYPLIPLEIDIKGDPLYLHDKRETYDFHCPSNLTHYEKKAVQDVAVRAHTILGLSHYSQSDFIVTKQGSVYLLETNSLPSLNDSAPLRHALHAVGSSRKELVLHLIDLALERK